MYQETKEYSLMLVDDTEQEGLVEIIVTEGNVDYDGNIEPDIMVEHDGAIWLLNRKYLDNVFVYKKAPKND
jgi:hypothetical protein